MAAPAPLKVVMISLIKKIIRTTGIGTLYHFLFAFAAAVVYGFPSRKLRVIGITGTKGKSSTVEILNSILEAAGKKTALCSSVRIKIGSETRPNTSGNTMPGRFFLQRFLHDAVEAGCTLALVEVTSQGVAQSRHRFIRWNIAALTNLAPEHIESHGSFERYRAAKLSFLEMVASQGGVIVLDAERSDAAFFRDHFARYPRALLYSISQLQRLGVANPVFGSEIWKRNGALAVCIAQALRCPPEAIRRGLEKFSGVPGRLEYVQREPFGVVVDYAHTPESLEAAYTAVKPNRGTLICVLGSAGGGRDRWKRPAMGTVAAAHCARIILTDEDPYDEDPEKIISEIAAGFPEGVAYEKIMDRAEAIQKAVSYAKPGDVVLATGKGSEQFIHLARGKKIPWSDKKVFEDAL